LPIGGEGYDEEMRYEQEGIDAAMWLRVADVAEAIFALDPDQDGPPRRCVYDALKAGRLGFGMEERVAR
jgi:hypothetical protein